MRTTSVIFYALSLVAATEAGPLRWGGPAKAPRHHLPSPSADPTLDGNPLPSTTEALATDDAEGIPVVSSTEIPPVLSASTLLDTVETSTFATSTLQAGPSSPDVQDPPAATTETAPPSGVVSSASGSTEEPTRPVVTPIPDVSPSPSPTLPATEAEESVGFSTGTIGSLTTPDTSSGSDVSQPTGVPLDTTAQGTPPVSLSDSATELPTATDLSSLSETADPVRPTVTGTPHSELPTVIQTSLPPTATVAPDVLASNLEEARAYNAIFAGLTEQSACTPGQVACVGGGIAVCDPDGGFRTRPCGGVNRACFAMPMNNTQGSILRCDDIDRATEILGTIPPGLVPSPSATASETALPTSSETETASASADPQPTGAPSDTATGRRTRTATVTVTTGTSTTVVTVDPPATASESPDVLPTPSSPSAFPTPSSPSIPPASSADPLPTDEPTDPVTRTATLTFSDSTATITLTIRPDPTDAAPTSQDLPAFLPPDFTADRPLLPTAQPTTLSTSTRASLVVIPVPSDPISSTTTRASLVVIPVPSDVPGLEGDEDDDSKPVTVTQRVTVTEKERETVTATVTATVDSAIATDPRF